MIDIPYSTLCRIESGEITSFEKYRSKLAAVLNCKPEDLDADEVEFATVPVVAIVKWKHYVKELSKSEWEPIQKPPRIPEKAKAIRVKGTHLTPSHHNGDVLYFDPNPETNERLFLNRECMVELDTKKRGERMICWVTPGTKEGRYLLHPPGSPPVLNAKLKAVYPIVDVFKRG